MASVKELLRAESDGTLSFGDYTLPAKTKKDNFEFEGDIYKGKDICGNHKAREERNVRIRVSAGKCSREF